MLVSGPAGSLSDRFGRLAILRFGWSFRILLLIGLAWSCSGEHPVLVWPIFLAYAASLAATEGAERALIADFAAKGQQATAFGLYHMVIGLAVLPGALFFGLVWQGFGPGAAFSMNALLSACAMFYLQVQYRRK